MTANKLIVGTVLITACILTSACENNDDTVDNGNYLYLPKTLNITDSLANTRRTEYTYDANNRMVEIADEITFKRGTADLTNTSLSQIEYDAQGRITKMTSHTNDALEGGLVFENVIVRNFSYPYTGEPVVIVDVENQTGFTETHTILLNQKQQVLKYTQGNGRFSLFEYDNKGNVQKITDESGKQYSFGSDAKRGVYREVNIPQWFINIVLNMSRNGVWFDMYETLGVQNNCTKIVEQHINLDDNFSPLERNYIIQYNPFAYPVSQSDNLKFKMTVAYTRAN
ncbi:hypothetical protein [Viscerimonas tarda]